MSEDFQPAEFSHGLDMEWRNHDGNRRAGSPHYHDFYEFFLFFGASMHYFVKDRTYPVGKYGIVFIDKNVYHRSEYLSAHHNERLLISFDDTIFDLAGGELARRRIAALFHNHVAIQASEVGARLCGILLREILPEYRLMGGAGAVGRLRATLRVVDLLLELSELDENGKLIDAEPASTRIESRIPAMVRYIDENYAGKISLSGMSATLFIDKYYMCRVFKKATGLTIIEFINNKRLAEAERMLKGTAKTVTAVAMSVGFNNASYFTEMFKAKYGMTPGEFRGRPL